MKKLPENANADIIETSCCGSQTTVGGMKSMSLAYRIVLGLLAVGIWSAIYRQLEPFATFLTYDILGL